MGEVIDKEVVDRIPGVSILPYNNNDEFLLIKQYFPSLDKHVWKIPRGGIEGGFNSIETPKQAVQRELYEETGYKAKRLILLFETHGSATVRHHNSYFVAEDLYKPKEVRNFDKNEFIEVIPLDRREAVEMAMAAKFQNPALALMVLKTNYHMKIFDDLTQ